MVELADRADWSGVLLRSERVGSSEHTTHLRFDGMQFVTEGEHLLAILLRKMGVDFTPNVKFTLKPPAERRSKLDVIYVPDFIFNRRAYLWRNEDGSVEVIHGIEAKGTRPNHFPRKALEKLKLLLDQRGINIKILSEKDIKNYVRLGALPMEPFTPK